MKAIAIYPRDREHYPDGSFSEWVIWRVETPVPPCSHCYKYRLVYIADGVRVLGYDNERGKGDHMHLNGEETPTPSPPQRNCWRIFSTPLTAGGANTMKKVIIDVAQPTLEERIEMMRRIEAGEWTPDADYYIHYSSARQLLEHLTAARMELLDRLRRIGPCSVYALAKAAGRHYANVHKDIAALEGEGLVERNDANQVLVPFDRVEIHLGLAAAA